MAHIREIKRRIKSIKESKQITNAMKLISAAKLKKARQQLEQVLPFFDKVKLTIADILMHSGNIENIFFNAKTGKEQKKTGYTEGENSEQETVNGEGRGKTGYIVITGDRGLAGGYNHNIIKLTEKELEKNPDSLLFVAGYTGRSYFTRKNRNIYSGFDYCVQNPTTYRAREMADMILDLYRNGELDEVYLIYTLMITTIKLQPQIIKLLPLDLESLEADLKFPARQNGKIDESMVYEPSPQVVFDILIPKYLKGIVYGALVEAFTSEQSARMTAMDNATSNAEEMLQSLRLYYNRARQAAITQEISEIIGGAAALKQT